MRTSRSKIHLGLSFVSLFVLGACGQMDSNPGDTRVTEDGSIIIPKGLRHPKTEQAVFTPNMTWESIQKLPKLWGVAWKSPQRFDAKAVTLNQIDYPPLNAEAMAQSKTRVDAFLAGKAEFQQASCKPFGMTRTIWFTSAPSFLFQPGGRLVMFQAEFREIWMDGRAHPDDIDASDNSAKYLGHSVGWWEGDTLVIDTVGIHPDHELYYGVKNGGEHVVERWSLGKDGNLYVKMTVDAPKVLDKPWVFEKYYERGSGVIGTDLSGGTGGARSMMCDRADARQKVNADGEVQLDLTPPSPGIH